MYLSADAPTRSIRPHPLADGRTLLVLEGEEHKTGQENETQARFAALESWATEHFDIRSVEYRWSAEDYMTPDRVPYVGRLRPSDERVLAATGFNKWGMTNGTAAAVMVTDLVLGRPSPWIDLFDAGRIKPESGAGTVVKENLNVAKRFVGDRVAALSAPSADELGPGDGGVVEYDGSRVAAHRDADGTLHAVSPVCTHMGCLVGWNGAEATWDCPCHGSRFSADGEVIEGPATEPLERISPK